MKTTKSVRNLLIASLLLGVAIGSLMGRIVTVYEWENTAILKAAAFYNPNNGEFTWVIDEMRRGK